MHNCCFLTILNELTFLLYPLDTRCVLNLVLNNVFFLWSMNVVYLDTLLVIYFIKNERSCHVLMMQFSGFSFHHSKGYNTVCQQKRGVEEESIVMKLCERRKKNPEQYLTVQLASELCNGSVACIPQPKLCKWAEAEYLRKDQLKAVNLL